MAQKFPYEKASMAIAEADIFGDQAILEKYNINQSTLWRWRDRATTDPKLCESTLLKTRMLLVDWQSDATKTIKLALNELTRRIPLAQDENDAKVISAIAAAIKNVGDLKLTSDALSEK